MDYSYAYLVGNLVIAFPAWLILFLIRKDLRKEMLAMSIMGAFLGPISEIIYFKDYWHPENFLGTYISIEDALFGFFIAGISAIIYKVLFKRKPSKGKVDLKIVASFIVLIAVFFFGTQVVMLVGLNSIYASSLIFALIAIGIFILKPSLIKNGLVTGALISVFMFVGYLILTALYPELFLKWWYLENLSGILLVGVPVEEIIWAFFWGMLAGPFYGFISRKRENMVRG